MLRKKRLKCGRIPVRLFLACHQKSNTFKCKQFCCAKPMYACLFMGCAPRPRQRRAAVHSLRLSVGSSAHSPVNSLRSNNTGNVAEAPPVADEARRCWRKTRSIAPAPRAIGDYVLRGLNGLRSKTHEPALVQAPARLRANVPSYRLRAASYVLRHGVVGSRGETPSLPFLCRRFFSQTEKKCRNAGSVKSLIIVGREGSEPIINKSILLYRLRR